MKLGLLLYSTDAEVVHNAFRLANFSLNEGDEVNVFLLASGVEYQSLNSEKFNITELAQQFIDKGGKLLACGTCLNLREQDGTVLCPLSNMKDLILLEVSTGKELGVIPMPKGYTSGVSADLKKLTEQLINKST